MIKDENEKLADLKQLVDRIEAIDGPNWVNDKELARQVRREIRGIWGLKKSAANEKFRKLFGYKVAIDPTISQEDFGNVSLLIKKVFDEKGLSESKAVSEYLAETVDPQHIKVSGDKATV